MLITICYSILSWIQGRQRQEVLNWFRDYVLTQKNSLLLVQERFGYGYCTFEDWDDDGDDGGSGGRRSNSHLDLDGYDDEESRDAFYNYDYNSTHGTPRSRNPSGGGGGGSYSLGLSRSSSRASTPRKELVLSSEGSGGGGGHHPHHHHQRKSVLPLSFEALSNFNNANESLEPPGHDPDPSSTFKIPQQQASELCYNHDRITSTRLVSENELTRTLAIFPQQNVELHDWTAFIGTQIQPQESSTLDNGHNDPGKIYILLEAEPGLTANKEVYRNYSRFGEVTAWKCDHELALILYSDIDQVIDLIHIFRRSQLILTGGWHVYRLTTITCEGTIGTLISRSVLDPSKTHLTPGDLRRITAGIYECPGGTGDDLTSASMTSSPRHSIPRDTSKHEITKISEEDLQATTATTCTSKVPHPPQGHPPQSQGDNNHPPPNNPTTVKVKVRIKDESSEHGSVESEGKSQQESQPLGSSAAGIAAAREAMDKIEFTKLPNWYERSPKKRSIATIPYCDRPSSSTLNLQRKTSLGAGVLSSTLGSKSSSLASLIFGSNKASSIDETSSSGQYGHHRQSLTPTRALVSPTTGGGLPGSALNSQAEHPIFNPLNNPLKNCKTPSRQSFECLGFIVPGGGGVIEGQGQGRLSPIPSGGSTSSTTSFTKSSSKALKSISMSTSAIASPDRGHGGSLGASGILTSSSTWKSPHRLGKPPNILILCQDEKMREKIAAVVKTLLSLDRYVIYDIRWDQLSVGGWADQTALLILSGEIPPPVTTHTNILTQFLGDGGRLFAWCCESHPFGVPRSKRSNPEQGGGRDLDETSCSSPLSTMAQEGSIVTSTSSSSETDEIPVIKASLTYGHSQTSPLRITGYSWGYVKDPHGLPANYQRILETSDSEGDFRPLTASVFGKIRSSNDAVILQLDGGSLGGKAVLSQVHFEDCMDNESCIALLSGLLGQVLGIDCTRIKTPDYTIGYLLGDHLIIKEFLDFVPNSLINSELRMEFVPRGENGPSPSHDLLPIHSLECPKTFSTLEYFDNLKTRELGRLVLYTEVITSTMNVFEGHSLRHGMISVASRQTSGKGRGKNKWLSPVGCASFVVHFHVNLDSRLGRKISLCQHAAALAVVFSVPNHKEIGLCVKWPNDIYLKDQKIGGVLVTSNVFGRKAVLNIGIGVNVANAYPTTSLNSALGNLPEPSTPASSASTGDLRNSIHPLGSKKSNSSILTPEACIARTLTQLELILDSLNGPENINKFLDSYVDNWIHNSEEEVNVEISDGKFVPCLLVGIDEFGFLRVSETGSGHVFSVRPEGNSFDIANRLIAIKHS